MSASRSPLGSIAAVAMLLLGLGAAACGDDGPSPAAGSTSDDAPTSDEADSGLGPLVCVPDERRSCYEGPTGSQGLGVCAAGQQTCAADGSGWSACEGQVLPDSRERCDTPDDDDCDGTAQCEPLVDWWREFPLNARALAFDSRGHAIVAGRTSQQLVIDEHELTDIYVASFDPQGQVAWSYSAEADNGSWVAGLVVGPDDRITVVGYYGGTPDFGGGPLAESTDMLAFVAVFSGEGEPLWSASHPIESWTAASVDAEGRTYLVGRHVDWQLDELPHEVLVVAAYTPEGTLDWAHHGYGVYGLYDATMTMVLPGSGEVVAVSGIGAEGLIAAEIGGMPLDLPSYGPRAIRFDPQGNPLGYETLFDEDTISVDVLDAFALEDGSISMIGNVYGIWDDETAQSVIVRHLDPQLQVLGELRLGDPAWSYAAAPAPDGSTVMALDFAGVLELGPVGATQPPSGYAAALTAVDAQGSARWLELMYGVNSVQVYGLAVDSGGGVLISVVVDTPSVIGGVQLDGNILVRLVP